MFGRDRLEYAVRSISSSRPQLQPNIDCPKGRPGRRPGRCMSAASTGSSNIWSPTCKPARRTDLRFKWRDYTTWRPVRSMSWSTTRAVLFPSTNPSLDLAAAGCLFSLATFFLLGCSRSRLRSCLRPGTTSLRPRRLSVPLVASPTPSPSVLAGAAPSTSSADHRHHPGATLFLTIIPNQKKFGRPPWPANRPDRKLARPARSLLAVHQQLRPCRCWC